LKFQLRKYGYVLTWTFLTSKTYTAKYRTTTFSTKERYIQFYLSENYGWVPMNMNNIDIGYMCDAFGPPKIFSTKMHARLSLQSDSKLKESMHRSIVIYKLKLKTPFPVIRKVSSKMWFTDPVKIKKVRKKMRW